ncbi:MAG: type II CAAX endopeptidase family protein, partial [Granulicella sp.]
MNDTQPDQHSLFFGDEGLRAGWGLLLYVALIAALFFAMQSAAGLLHHTPAPKSSLPHEQSPAALLISESVSFLLVAFASWIMSRIEHRSSGEYGLGGDHKLSRFLGGTGWGIAFLSLLILTLKLTGLLVFDRRLLYGTNILRYSLVWVVGFLFVALLEEYLLRGYLQFTLTRGLHSIYEAIGTSNSRAVSFWTAALLLSCVFGLGHRSNPGESPIGLFAAAVAGLVFCLSLWRTGSLWWAIGFHASWDWAQSFFYGVPDSGTMIQFHLFATHPVGKPLLSGGATGPEGSLFILPIMALIACVILFTLPKS